LTKPNLQTKILEKLNTVVTYFPWQ